MAMRTGIERLPFEILSLIFDLVCEKPWKGWHEFLPTRDLLNLVLVSRGFYHVSLPFLYRRISLDDMPTARACLRTLLSNDIAAGSVQALLLHSLQICPADAPISETVYLRTPEIVQVLMRARNLSSLTVNVPWRVTATEGEVLLKEILHPPSGPYPFTLKNFTTNLFPTKSLLHFVANNSSISSLALPSLSKEICHELGPKKLRCVGLTLNEQYEEEALSTLFKYHSIQHLTIYPDKKHRTLASFSTSLAHTLSLAKHLSTLTLCSSEWTRNERIWRLFYHMAQKGEHFSCDTLTTLSFRGLVYIIDLLVILDWLDSPLIRQGLPNLRNLIFDHVPQPQRLNQPGIVLRKPVYHCWFYNEVETMYGMREKGADNWVLQDLVAPVAPYIPSFHLTSRSWPSLF